MHLCFYEQKNFLSFLNHKCLQQIIFKDSHWSILFFCSFPFWSILTTNNTFFFFFFSLTSNRKPKLYIIRNLRNSTGPVLIVQASWSHSLVTIIVWLNYQKLRIIEWIHAAIMTIKQFWCTSYLPSIFLKNDKYKLSIKHLNWILNAIQIYWSVQ